MGICSGGRETGTGVLCAAPGSGEGPPPPQIAPVGTYDSHTRGGRGFRTEDGTRPPRGSAYAPGRGAVEPYSSRSGCQPFGIGTAQVAASMMPPKSLVMNIPHASPMPGQSIEMLLPLACAAAIGWT